MSKDLMFLLLLEGLSQWSSTALPVPNMAFLVWPPAKSISASGPPTALGASFRVEVEVVDIVGSRDGNDDDAARLARAVARYSGLIQRVAARSSVARPGLRQVGAPPAVERLRVRTSTGGAPLSARTDYSYALRLNGSSTGVVDAASIYGAMYALESFTQLVEAGGVLPYSELAIEDAPTYAWRGLMLDAGRRFFPVDSVKNTLDSMAAAKMNVLHLHASDNCRFGVQSLLYPNLTAALVGILAGHYSQADVADLVAYAGDRGIRIVPEFDVPGHSRGMIPAEADGAVFCDPTDGGRDQRKPC
jgi:hexosaminidase